MVPAVFSVTSKTVILSIPYSFYEMVCHMKRLPEEAPTKNTILTSTFYKKLPGGQTLKQKKNYFINSNTKDTIKKA